MGIYQELNIEKDFWDDFIVEAFEHIEEIETNAMSLEQNPEDMEIIHTMFRAYHTIKGLSGFVEHFIIQELAHKTETMMDLCRKGELKVNTQIVDAILKSSDYIKQMCNDVDAYKDQSLIENIEKLLIILEELSTGAPTEHQQEQAPAEQPFVENQEQQFEAPAEQPFVENQEQQFEAPAEQQFVENQDQSFEAHDEQQFVENQEQSFEAHDEQQFVENQEQSFEAHDEQQFVENQEQSFEAHDEQQFVENQEQSFEAHDEQPFEAPAEQPFVKSQEQSVEPTENGLEAFANEICEIENNLNEEQTQEPSEQQVDQSEQYSEAPTEQPQMEFFEQPAIEASATIITEASTNETAYSENNKRTEEPAVITAENIALKAFQSKIMAKLNGTDISKEDNSGNTSVKHSAANEEYMKVANYKIDHLVDMMGELIINQALIEQYVALNYSEDRQLVANMSGFLRITRELQNLSMSLRMVALKPTFQKLARIARDTIQELKRDVEFIMEGENTEIDRAVAEKMLDPLVHMIKNAISHGVEENPDDRIPLGKNRKAKVHLCAYSKRGKIFIEVRDDGKGINTEIVYNKALEKGLIDQSRTYSEAEIKEFIMMPGFSTAAVVDNISGRGVGMDVVRTQILKLGGKIDIQSTLNEGSTFILEVPVNHAIVNGTIIEMNKQHFVVPTVNVKEFLQPEDSQWIFTKSQRTMIKVRDNIIPIVPLGTFFKGAEEPKHVPLVMVIESDQELRAIPITNVINRQEVVVRPLGTEFSHLKFISGMSILGTGKVSLILDIDYLFRKGDKGIMADNYQKLLTFSLGSEGYGISILKVKEIIGMMDITPIPRTPEFIKGVINLRGKIIPVMDLRIKFGMDAKDYNERTCVIVAEVLMNGVQKLLGVVVDMVSEVVTISDEQIEPPPEYGTRNEHSSILGIGKIKDRVVIILDIDEVFLCEEVTKMLENVKELQNV